MRAAAARSFASGRFANRVRTRPSGSRVRTPVRIKRRHNARDRDPPDYAADLGKRATIFVAARAKLHPRTLEAARLGAKVIPVRPGYRSVVQARAKDYAKKSSARLVPFGVDLPEAIARIADAARATGLDPDEVWCAAGSGVLARALAQAWPRARRHVVQVGRALAPEDVANATIHIYPRPFSDVAKAIFPFPSDPHYDAKAWETMTARKGPGRVVFWNVVGAASV